MKIRRVRSILTAPGGQALVIVKVETDEPELYGLGCATFRQRATVVAKAVDDYLDPLLRGRDPRNIDDLWHMMMVNAAWRNGPVLNNAVSGVDIALWDIKGKLAGMPVYELLGGRCRDAAMVYTHADGNEPAEVLENVIALRERGYRAVRCQLGGYGGRVVSGVRGAVGENAAMEGAAGVFPGVYYDPDAYARSIPPLFEFIRSEIGFDLFLLHDVHERLAPIDAIRLGKALEPYRLFFYEDPLAPDQIEWFRRLREHCATPIAMGELHVNPLEWRPLVAEQLVDYVRAHISAIGGLTPARKLAALCEAFGVRTAWHGPADVSPVGHAVNLHLDLACHNFGIQEAADLGEAVHEVFPGTPAVRDGHFWPSEAPGLGIDLDEERAARYPIVVKPVEWTQTRWPDGTLWTP